MSAPTSSRKNRRRSVAEVPPGEVPWAWQALALLALALVGVWVCGESAVQHRRPAATTSGERIDINFGSQAQLESLPGIGPALARAIIAARPFATAQELSRVRGIGPQLLEKLLPAIKAARGRRAADMR